MTWIVSRPTGTKKGHREIIQATFFLKVFLFLGKSRCVTNEKKKRNWEKQRDTAQEKIKKCCLPCGNIISGVSEMMQMF